MILQTEKSLTLDRDLINHPNIAGMLTAGDRTMIGGMIWRGYERDKLSRSKWEKRSEAAMDLAMQIQKEKSFPWPGASNVIFPLITIAALQFSARSYANIIQGTDVVQYRIACPDEKGLLRAQGDRISSHMSWQVLEEDLSWEEQHDRLLINVSIVGTTFIKTYFSGRHGHNVSEMVAARDLIIDYWAKSVDEAVRKTHLFPLYPNEIYERVRRETFCDVLDSAWFNNLPSEEQSKPKTDNRTGTVPPEPDEDSAFDFLEQHRFLDLDHDGYAEPYICTIEKGSKELVRVTARFDDEAAIEKTPYSHKVIKIHSTEYFTKYSFIPAADGGIYDTGFGTLIGPINESVNTGINQLFDAGTMSNSNGGFLARGAKIRGGAKTFCPWEWVRVDMTGDDLKKSMVPLPVREPSMVLFQLIGLLVNYADRIAGTVDQMVGENPGQNTPAETSRNTAEQGMAVYSTIFKRLWRSFKEEFKKLHRLNARNLPAKKVYGQGAMTVLKEDYSTNPDMVIPVADPNLTSDGMRFKQAEILRTAAHSVNGYDIEKVERRFLRALKVDGAAELYPGPSKTPPLPNPKMQVEEMKLQGMKMKIDHDKWKLMRELEQQVKLNNAQIALLEAQAMKLLADATVEQQAQRVEAFDVAINAFKTHNDVLNDRIKLLGEMQSGNPDDGPDSGVANPRGNGSVPSLPSNVAGEPQGSMGS